MNAQFLQCSDAAPPDDGPRSERKYLGTNLSWKFY